MRFKDNHNGYWRKFLKAKGEPDKVTFVLPCECNCDIVSRFFTYILAIQDGQEPDEEGHYTISPMSYGEFHDMPENQASQEFDLGKKIFAEGVNMGEAGELMGLKLYYAPTVTLRCHYKNGEDEHETEEHIISGLVIDESSETRISINPDLMDAPMSFEELRKSANLLADNIDTYVMIGDDER